MASQFFSQQFMSRKALEHFCRNKHRFVFHQESATLTDETAAASGSNLNHPIRFKCRPRIILSLHYLRENGYNQCFFLQSLKCYNGRDTKPHIRNNVLTFPGGIICDCVTPGEGRESLAVISILCKIHTHSAFSTPSRSQQEGA